MSRSPDVLSIIPILMEEINVLQAVHPICYGIDGHAAQLTAYLRQVGEDGTSDPEWRDFGTTYDELLALWLRIISYSTQVVHELITPQKFQR